MSGSQSASSNKSRKRSSIFITSNLVPNQHSHPAPTPANVHLVTDEEMNAYFSLLEDDPTVVQFLRHDSCRLRADRYLLAMVFVYFKRCEFSASQYSADIFFRLLYLAHDVVEDNDELKFELFPWALGPCWRENMSTLMRDRDVLWSRMQFRGVVSRRCCDEVMSIQPGRPAWQRVRPQHHTGAIRYYLSDRMDTLPIGPHLSPRKCELCSWYKNVTVSCRSLKVDFVGGWKRNNLVITHGDSRESGRYHPKKKGLVVRPFNVDLDSASCNDAADSFSSKKKKSGRYHYGSDSASESFSLMPENALAHIVNLKRKTQTATDTWIDLTDDNMFSDDEVDYDQEVVL